MSIYNRVSDPVLLRQNEQLQAELAQVKEAIGLEVTTDEDETTVIKATKLETIQSEISTVAEAVATVATDDVKATLKGAIEFDGVI